MEWPEATRQQRREFLFPDRLIVQLALGFLTGICLGLIETRRTVDLLLFAVFGLLGAIVPLSIQLIRCGIQIRRSIARYQQKLLIKAGYGPNVASQR